MVSEEKINKDYELTSFQKKELSKLYKNNVRIIDFFVDDEDDDLVLKIKDDTTVIEQFVICKNEDVYFSCIGKFDSNLDRLEKVN
jgi:hypothetical protein